MKTGKHSLVGSVAVIALLSGAAALPAQTLDTNSDSAVSADSTLGDGEVGNSTDLNADGQPLRQEVEEGVAEAGDALEQTGDVIGDAASDAGDALETTADAAGNALEDGAETTGEAVSATADTAGEVTEETVETTGDAASATAEATDDALAGSSATATAEADVDTGIDTGVQDRTAGALIGTEVASSEGETVGEIDDFIRVDDEVMAVIGVGGFLGLGEHSVALPLTELDWQGETVTAFGYTEQQLKDMAEYDSEVATSLEADEQVEFGGSS